MAAKNIVPRQNKSKKIQTNKGGRNYVKKDPKDYLKRGRPSDYSEEVADQICKRLMKGETLTKICSDPEMPDLTTVYTWLRDTSPFYRKEFLQSYLVARQIQGEVEADKGMDILDKATSKTIVVAKARADYKKWRASKLYPRKFADKVQLTGNEDEPFIPKEQQKRKIKIVFVKADKSKYENEMNNNR